MEDKKLEKEKEEEKEEVRCLVLSFLSLYVFKEYV